MDLLGQRMEQLREEQVALERQLQTCDSTVPSCATQRSVRELSVNINITARRSSTTVEPLLPRTQPTALAAVPAHEQPDSSGATLQGSGDAGRAMTLKERLQQLETLKRKYQRQASKSMSEYFAAVSDHSRYQQQRERQLTSARGFSFESRELTRPTRIRSRREEEERQRREREERAARANIFRATPVPPTTFMNKYDLMVEEWCERKAAAELRAREKADVAREEAAYIRLSAQGLRHTREELLGAIYDPHTGRAMTRSELRRRRAQSADAAAARRAVQPDEIPLEVRMRLWPAIEEHEHVRTQRIKQTAAVKKTAADEEFRAAMPLLSSPTPHLLGAAGSVFGIGQPIAQPVAPAPPPGALGVGAAVPPPPAPAAAPPAEAPALSTARPALTPAAAAPINRNFTFKPNVTPGVPDFKGLWAEDRAQLLERKQSRPTTTPRPFNITRSAREDVVRGKRPRRVVSVPPPPPVSRTAKRAPSAKPPTRSTSSSSNNKAAAASGHDTAAAALPKGTRAHALRTEAIYSKNVTQSKGEDAVAAADQEFLKEAARRRRAVGKRLAEYVTDTRALHEHLIHSKVRALRTSAKENDEAAEQRLAEMRTRVAQMPPLFAEPTRMNEESRARAEAEEHVVGLLKQSGLDAGTIRDILVGAPTAAATAAADEEKTSVDAPASPGAAPAETADAAPAAEDKPKDTAEEKADATEPPSVKGNKPRSSPPSASSSSSDSSASGSSSSSASTAPSESGSSHSGSGANSRRPPAVTATLTSPPTAPVLPVPSLSGGTAAVVSPSVPSLPSSSPAAVPSLSSAPALVVPTVRTPAATSPPVVPVPSAVATKEDGYDSDSFEASSDGSSEGSH